MDFPYSGPDPAHKNGCRHHQAKAYWYKDQPINFYGEVYSYDANTLSIVAET
jgi:hypothetical protein